MSERIESASSEVGRTLKNKLSQPADSKEVCRGGEIYFTLNSSSVHISHGEGRRTCWLAWKYFTKISNLLSTCVGLLQ